VKIEAKFIETLMEIALEEANLAQKSGEVPIGAVLGLRGKVIARAHNEMERQRNATAHAEVLAIGRGGELLGDWRLNDAVLCVTVEPCTMCAGAISLSRIGTVVFGVADPRLGAYGSLYDISQDERLGATPRVISGVRENECRGLMQRFFSERRAR
jgi:tRNA(adenine34) deaminase